MGLIRLTRLPGSQSAVAFGISDEGVMVAVSTDGESHAVTLE